MPTDPTANRIPIWRRAAECVPMIALAALAMSAAMLPFALIVTYG